MKTKAMTMVEEERLRVAIMMVVVVVG